MAKNYMQDVARMLGVELEEEFKIAGYDGSFVLTNKGLMWINPKKWRSSDAYAFENLLTGRNELVTQPWQPQDGEFYYFPAVNFQYSCPATWSNNSTDFALKEAGMIFKTKAECEAALPALRKKYLGGESNE